MKREAEILYDDIVKATQNGPVWEWVERIAAIARDAGLKLEDINWQGSPALVALRVIESARKHGLTDKLKAAVDRRTAATKKRFALVKVYRTHGGELGRTMIILPEDRVTERTLSDFKEAKDIDFAPPGGGCSHARVLLMLDEGVYNRILNNISNMPNE